ncbi:GCN5-related N-acetyltransferase [Segniliparus rotundus DSM 44985]|uniref:GCN5-related N-acetyltransferase n=1 Tax=Segniliparus rotundus (strain ATCC BAA-972 / CDC 1076 / CIP 108378 / DSM 44985 / JCM 13578) TaxID=640132 RepID=D6Z858_SEGRD|nr:GNAT family N-acetyltransferase [Segniliparus rotundus]ADG98138.1 GCN5-related N-acetyltransferase [Segniliparus rotundus DSM 44985]
MPSHLEDPITYASPGEHDHAALRAMARRSFSETFARLHEPSSFAEFLDCSYGEDGTMAHDLNDPAVRWLAGLHRGEPVGYAKLTPLRAPAPRPLPGSVELQQIYVLADWHGRGVADRLMQWALAAATELRAPQMYLTVFDHNERAKRLYRRHGFVEVGRCAFVLGGRAHDDRIWLRDM